MTLLRVRTQMTGVTGSPWLSTSWFHSVGASATQAEADAAVVKVGTFWAATDAHMHTSVAWATLPEVGELNTSGTLVGSFATTPQSGAGGTGGDILPFATQLLLRLLTNSFIGGRQIRGRLFVPGITETGSVAGVPAAATLAAILGFGVTLGAATTPRLAVWSRVNVASSEVTQVTAWSQWAVLRSRRD